MLTSLLSHRYEGEDPLMPTSYPLLWDFLLYTCSVVTYLCLFWIHKSVSRTTSQTADRTSSGGNGKNKSKQLERNGIYLQVEAGDTNLDALNNNTIKSRLKEKAQKRINSFRRRKELVEKDIIINLGLTPDEKGFEAFCDKFNSIETVGEALKQSGFQACDVIIGIDFTASNEWQGKRSFGRSSLHKIQYTRSNPYQKVLKIIGKTLAHICNDNSILTYGFGDTVTRNHSVFPVHTAPILSSNYTQVIESYVGAASSVQLGGPTNFAPIIRKAMETCQTSRAYHILFLIVDGLVSEQCEQETIETIVEASEYPLSIVVIGVGDGPFGRMFEYDDGLPKRKFDNLQFVNFHRTVTKPKHEAAFALHALMEIPDQYKAINQLGLLNS